MKNDERNEGMWEEINRNRDSMKCPDFSVVMPSSDQEKKLPQPPLCNAARGELIRISADFENIAVNNKYADILDIRRSGRLYDRITPMSQNQLAFLLWSTQGIQEIRGDNYAALRPVPSGGARHAFETYFVARNIEGLEAGIYHYLPHENIGDKNVTIEFIGVFPDHKELITKMLVGQKWVVNAAVTFFYSCVAYRAEWRYNALAHRVALIDLGHVGQNLMLSAAAMDLGSCCIAAYDQALCDKTLGLDGYEEYTVYVCTAGKLKRK